MVVRPDDAPPSAPDPTVIVPVDDAEFQGEGEGESGGRGLPRRGDRP
ncbi:hypothetical protein [Streptomyces sp. URMC 123]